MKDGIKIVNMLANKPDGICHCVKKDKFDIVGNMHKTCGGIVEDAKQKA